LRKRRKIFSRKSKKHERGTARGVASHSRRQWKKYRKAGKVPRKNRNLQLSPPKRQAQFISREKISIEDLWYIDLQKLTLEDGNSCGRSSMRKEGKKARERRRRYSVRSPLRERFHKKGVVKYETKGLKRGSYCGWEKECGYSSAQNESGSWVETLLLLARRRNRRRSRRERILNEVGV